MGQVLAVPTACPNCNGPLWDNRDSKKNPKAPDFKCRDKSCDGVFWPPRNGDKWADKVPAKPAPAPSPAVGDLPGDPAASYGAPAPASAPTPARPTLAELAGCYDRCLGFAKKIAAKHEGEIQWTAGAITAMAATLYIEANRRGVDA